MFTELKVYDHGLSPLPVQNRYLEIILGIKSFKNFCCTCTNVVQNLVENNFASLQIKYKLYLKIHSQHIKFEFEVNFISSSQEISSTEIDPDCVNSKTW